MKKTVNIVVIGTEPPCPRCDLLDVLVRQAAPHELAVDIQHCAFDSDFAQQLGKSLDRKIGTARHVADKAGILMNWDSVYTLIKQKTSPLDPDFRPADAWTQELDDILRPCQDIAEASGCLMTPVLVIDDKVVHHGSVPAIEQIISWLSNELSNASKSADCQGIL